MTRPASSASSDGAAFDKATGSWVERALFNHRGWVISVCLLLTLCLGALASQLKFNASFEKTIPTHHPYIANYLAYQSELHGLGNSLRIIVESTVGPNGTPTIYDARYLEQLRRLSDELFLIPGVKREQMKSLWTPNTRWTAVTEDGLEGGQVIPQGYDGSPRSLQDLATNIARSGELGQTVALDGRSSAIVLPLLKRYADGSPIDYAQLSQTVEALRTAYEAKGLRLHITGFAKIVGDLLDGLRSVAMFFALAIAIAAAMVYGYTRCVRSTLLVVSASLVAVLWQLGMLRLLGYSLDPYLVLVPFLVFAIGMSHGAQKMNGIMQDVGRGIHKLAAARFTFRRLFLAGLTALLADAVGFAVLLSIDIQAIRELAIAASIGVAALIVTNLILLPILLSYTGVSVAAAKRSLRDESAHRPNALWRALAGLTQPAKARWVVLGAMVLAVVAGITSRHLSIGDLDAGAPELRADSRYNRDAAYINASYGASNDVFAVMVKTPENQCAAYSTLMKLDALQWELGQTEGVDSTQSLALLNRRALVGLNEGSPKWYELLKNQDMLNTVTAGSPRGLYNDNCSLLTLYVYLRDHRAQTLTRVVDRVAAFAEANNSPQMQVLMAAGNAGIEAATNIVVKQAWWQMLMLVYAAVVVLAFITFRSWRAVVVAVLPLMLTSIAAEALMVWLGIGVKVSTLPVIALGVGIGIDYALYILSVMLVRLAAGDTLKEAYLGSLRFTGRVVMLTGVTLAVGVGTWVFSPIKFQADMGMMLAFMFVWNMLGALVLLPALAAFVLQPRHVAHVRYGGGIDLATPANPPPAPARRASHPRLGSA